MHRKSNIKLALANANLGLAVDIENFLGTVIQEEFDDQVLIYHTQRDEKVDDFICKPLEGEEFKFGDIYRPSIPDDLHPNCRCFWEDAETGEILGQDGFFASPEFGSAEGGRDNVDGKDGYWKTVKGTKVFFPDDEDPKDVIDKAFKNKPKTPKQKQQETYDKIKKDLFEENKDVDDEIVEREPRGELDHEVDVDGYTVPIGEDEEEYEGVEDFRDKNKLWEKAEPLSEHFDIRDNQAITRQGERLEDGLRETGDWGNNPRGSTFLTRDGKFVGFGGDTDHRISVSGAEAYSGIKLEEERPEGNAWTRSDDLDKFMRISGTARITTRSGLGVDITHPLSSSQRDALEHYVIEKGLTSNDIYFDKSNRAKEISDDSLFRSIGAFGSLSSATADTIDGKEGVWRTVRGTPVFFPDGEDPKEVIAKRFKSPVKPAKKSKQDNPVRFQEARKLHDKFVKGKEDQSYSFDPVSNKGYDAFNPEQAKEAYKEYGNGSDPVYFITASNHGGQLSRESEADYIKVFNEGKRPLIGHYVSEETGFDYTDISWTSSSKSETKRLLKQHAQESALYIRPDGTVDFLNAE